MLNQEGDVSEEHQSEQKEGYPETPLSSVRLKLGVFPWSDSSLGSVKLQLAHPEVSETGEMKTVTVNCLDVCPTGDFIATGREDGVANIWRYGFVGNFPGISIYSNGLTGLNAAFIGHGSPANASSSNLALEGLRGAVSDAEFEIWENIGKYLILRLVGHVAPITDIRFNSKGDRLITGSMNEGAVRIWSFSSNFRKCDHLVLSMNEFTDAEPSLNRRQRSTRSKNKLFNISWSNSDVFVLTMQGIQGAFESHPTRLKVWDSMTGILLKSIQVSNDEANVLALHPIDSSLVATAGADGLVSIWNLRSDRTIFEYKVLCPPNTPNIAAGTPIKILDASFSADGHRLIVTDHIGRLLVFGVQQTLRYEGVLSEQYFSSDYNDFYLDDNGLPIDIGTNLPIHLVPSSYLCRMDGSSYGIDYVVKSVNAALPKETVKRELKVRRSWVNARLKYLETSFKLFKRYKSRYASNPIESRVVIVENKKPLPSRRSLVPLAEDTPTREQEISDRDLDDSDNDEDWASVGSSDGEGETVQRRSTRFSSWHDDDPRMNNNRRSRRLRTLRSYDDPRRNRSRRIVVIEDEDDDNGSSEDDASSSRSVKRKKPAKAKRVRDTAEASVQPPDRRSKEPVIDTQFSWRCGSKQRRVPIDVSIYREWALSDEPSDFQYCPQLGDAVIYFPQGHAEHLMTFHETAQPPWTSFPIRWVAVECIVTDLQFDFPTQAEHRRSNSVVATVGLKMVGIPLHAAGTSSNYSLTEFSRTSTRSSSLDRAEYSSFKVVMRKGTGVPDFLIPSFLYHRAAAVRWRAGMRFQSPFIEGEELKLYQGIVLDITDYDDAFPHSPWECLKVQWDDEGDKPGEGKTFTHSICIQVHW